MLNPDGSEMTPCSSKPLLSRSSPYSPRYRSRASAKLTSMLRSIVIAGWSRLPGRDGCGQEPLDDQQAAVVRQRRTALREQLPARLVVPVVEDPLQHVEVVADGERLEEAAADRDAAIDEAP